MCCLKYEHETYEEAIKRIAPVGATVKTPDGVGVVSEIKPLAEELKVKFTDNEKETIKLYKSRDVKILSMPGKKDKSKDEDEIEEN